MFRFKISEISDTFEISRFPEYWKNLNILLDDSNVIILLETRFCTVFTCRFPDKPSCHLMKYIMMVISTHMIDQKVWEILTRDHNKAITSQ